MNVGNTSPILPYVAPPREAERAAPDQPRPADTQPPQHAPRVASDPPKGVQPELWQLLSDAERAFLTEQMSLGPITYAPHRTQPPGGSMSVGQRIDVKA